MLVTLYDKLMESAEDGSYQGWLLDDISPNEDFTVWTGNLKQGIMFHNGVELTAQTLQDMFPIQQEGSQSAGQIAASALADVQATGDYEVTYTLSRANSAFPAYLARAQLGFVFEPGAAAADPDGFNEAPVGTGPFLFESRDLDNETVVVRNPDYWMTDQNGTQLPYLDRIAFRPIPDEGTRLDAFMGSREIPTTATTKVRRTTALSSAAPGLSGSELSCRSRDRR